METGTLAGWETKTKLGTQKIDKLWEKNSSNINCNCVWKYVNVLVMWFRGKQIVIDFYKPQLDIVKQSLWQIILNSI